MIVEEGARITARHIRVMEQAGLEQLEVPMEYVCGHVLTNDIVDPSTGEIVVLATVSSPKRFLRSSKKLVLRASIQFTPMILTAARSFLMP